MLAATPALHQVADDIAEIKQRLYKMDITNERKAVFDFFGTFDAEPNYQQARKSRQAGTGLWLVESDELKTWLSERNARLWMHGIPGSGKTVLASAIIDESIRTASTTVAFAYHFCDYKDQKKQKLSNLLASLLGQLARQSRRCFDMLQKCCRPSPDDIARHDLPDVHESTELLQRMATCFDDVMIVIDGVDEASQPGEVSQTLYACVAGGSRNIRIALLIREEPEIKRQLDGFTRISIKARSSDLRLYVSSEIESRIKKGTLRIRSSSLKDEILEQLVDGADGMFRWVSCQLDYLCELPSDAQRLKALRGLPPDLNETYHRIFQRVNSLPEVNRTLVQRTLQWLILLPEIKSDQLCEAISIELGDETLDPEAIPDVEEILSRCSSLVRLSIDGDAIELAHFTVKEYLRGAASSVDPLTARFQFDAGAARAYAVTTMLTCINMEQFSFLPRTFAEMDHKFDNHPFYKFASTLWHAIISEHELGSDEWSLVCILFDPKQNNSFKAWVQMIVCGMNTHGLRWLYGEFNDSGRGALHRIMHASPLHFASMLQWPQLVLWLIEQRCDVNEYCPYLGVPLHGALLGLERCQFDDHMYSNEWSQPRWLSHCGRILLTDAEDPSSLEFLRRRQDVVRNLLHHGGRWDLPFSRYGTAEGIPTILLASLTDTELIFGEAGARVDGAALEYLSKLPATILQWFPARKLRGYIQFNQLSSAEWSIAAALGFQGAEMETDALHSPSSAIVYRQEVQSLEAKIIMSACESDDVDNVHRLHDEHQVDLDQLPGAEDYKDLTPFLVAARHCSNKVLKYLLRHKVNRQLQFDKNGNAIHHCLSGNLQNIGTLQLLLDAGIDYNFPDASGESPLHVCAKAGSIAHMKMLLGHWADPCAIDASGDSLMHAIAMYDRLAMYLFLKRWMSPAEWNRQMLRKNDSGVSPVHVAARDSPSIFRSMLETGVHITQRSNDGRNVWHFTCQGIQRQLESLELLSTDAIAPLVASYDGTTALHDMVQALDRSLFTHYASVDPVKQALSYLKEAGIRLDAINDAGQTVLHSFAETWRDCTAASTTGVGKGLVAQEFPIFFIVRDLLGAGVDPLSVSSEGQVCLDIYLEAFEKHPTLLWLMLKLILDAIPTQSLLAHGREKLTLLAWAANHNLADLCQYLMERGADPDQRWLKIEEADLTNDEALTPLETVCVHGCTDASIRAALHRTHRLHSTSRKGLGLLHLAAGATSTDHNVIDVLSEHGIDVNVRAQKKFRCRTALMSAVEAQRSDLVGSLLRHNADVNAIDSLSWSALTVACLCWYSESAEVLLQAGCSITAMTTYVGLQKPLQLCHRALAALWGNVNILRELMDHKYGQDPVTDVSPLWTACWGGQKNCAEYLFKGDADLAVTEPHQGLTLLHAAAHGGHVDIVEWLLQRGCHVDSRDRSGLLPI